MPSREPGPDPTLEPPLDGEPTKRCPYCAETIKAAAIKCRFCHSDLAVAAVAPAAGRAAEPPGEAPVETTATGAPGLDGRSSAGASDLLDQREEGADLLDQRERRPRWVLVPVAAAVVATLVFLGLAFEDWRDAEDLAQSADAAHTVRAAVTDEVEALLSYKYSSFDGDQAAAEKVMTSSFQDEYAPTADEIRDRAVSQKRTQQAQVAAVSVIDASPDQVTALVFVNTVSFTEGAKRQRLMQNRVKVTLVEQDGQWLIDDLSVPLS